LNDLAPRGMLVVGLQRSKGCPPRFIACPSLKPRSPSEACPRQEGRWYPGS
jgi:hypothetical protein